MGWLDGCIVGETVGCDDGSPDGWLDGSVVGRPVGCIVGCPDGCPVGSNVNCGSPERIAKLFMVGTA
jgi:hypothetical protein